MQKLITLMGVLWLAIPPAHAGRLFSLGLRSEIQSADAKLQHRNPDGSFAPGKRRLRSTRADRFRRGDIILWGGAPTLIHSLRVRRGKVSITVRASDRKLVTRTVDGSALLLGAKPIGRR
jgi:hypothetical protein